MKPLRICILIDHKRVSPLYLANLIQIMLIMILTSKGDEAQAGVRRRGGRHTECKDWTPFKMSINTSIVTKLIMIFRAWDQPK